MIRTYKRKLILTKAQEARINSWIGVCRLVYNMGLEIRIEAYKKHKKSVHRFELMKQFAPLRAEFAWIKDTPFTSLQATVERLDSAYSNFYRTFSTGGGFPKFASKKKYNSITFKDGVDLKENKIKIPKLGNLKIFKDASIMGVLKRATIKREPTGYFISIVCDEVTKTIQNPDESQVCGIDMGLAYFCVDSNGKLIENPKHFKRYEAKLRIENRSLARKKKGSASWVKQVKKLALLHHKIGNVRKDFLHKESTKLAKAYNTVYVEDLKINNMARNKNLSKHILDSGWGMFLEMLEYKTNVVRVDPKYTSQTCNECGVKDSVSRVSQSEFKCTACGHIANADINAAKNILSKGIALNR